MENDIYVDTFLEEVVIPEKSDDFLSWIFNSRDKAYHDLITHKNFKRFLSMEAGYGVLLSLLGKYKDMPYRIDIIQSIRTLKYEARLYSIAEVSREK